MFTLWENPNKDNDLFIKHQWLLEIMLGMGTNTDIRRKMIHSRSKIRYHPKVWGRQDFDKMLPKKKTQKDKRL